MLFDCLPRLNIGSKNLALISAALLLLDYSATAIVSAATAVSYVSGEVHLPFPPIIGTLLILVIFALVGLAGLRESARIASVVLSMHVSRSHKLKDRPRRNLTPTLGIFFTAHDYGHALCCFCRNLGTSRK